MLSWKFVFPNSPPTHKKSFFIKQIGMEHHFGQAILPGAMRKRKMDDSNSLL